MSPQNIRRTRTDMSCHISASSFQASTTSKSTIEIDRLSIKINPTLRVSVEKGLHRNLLNASEKVTTKLELRNHGHLAQKIIIELHSCNVDHGIGASPCLPWSMPPIVHVPPGVPHHSVCGIIDPSARLQCRRSSRNLCGGTSENENHSVDAVIVGASKITCWWI